MNESKLKLTIGGLLHDTGKILYRGNDGGNHSISGYNFLKNETNLNDNVILEQVLYHHGRPLRNADISDLSFAYITYIADNISAGMDRRENDDAANFDFDRNMPLQSIFNILNGNRQKYVYKPGTLDNNTGVNYPTDEPVVFSESFYERIKDNIKDSILGIESKDEYINSLLEVLEANLSFIPSSTSTKELADISLYDHIKLTAAIGCCIYDYLEEKEIKNYKQFLYEDSQNFYHEKAFMIYSLDISGIQDFIYTITSKKALKNLRSRSFYLEIMLEHLIDEILDQVGLSRANVIYTGGGHAYLILPNTNKVRENIAQFENSINNWFLETFNIALYIAGGYSICNANDLKNNPSGSYKAVFSEISRSLSKRKLQRYNADDVIKLNTDNIPHGERECEVCKRSDMLSQENKCKICEALEIFSASIIDEKKDFFTIIEGKHDENALPLPINKLLIADSRQSLTMRMKNDSNYVRSYGKNDMYTGFHFTTKLWVGDYNNGNTFEDLAKASGGIERLGVLRADVDNLGQAFVSGFEGKESGDKYVTLSRTATFSRKLSMFFKLHMNDILEDGIYYLKKDYKKGRRNATIVYSGGDDVFIVGSWDDIIGFAIDLHNSLKEYSQNTLSISAGIGIYHSTYPISAMAL
ncbi:MAG: type III-A CRISPR-associated protein Cas10/Csm1 [Tepidanaerobacteraceae bacterium]|nr:type III-A CRISPR-associated protein Cas10/Csm1 [Tepidanaerobacteraceae bacterium]